ncbi:twin-arginine translocation signal domain-containing protein [Sulfurospirillum arcachonense]|uniref:twin-arginine translocation signal domain-containing protein n=1 Tax=Sulfurospirillum arcachonense TaxID=57666 RepID=UPI000468F1B0|nr:twin-arginine translocation signal domain-containing protein [Sulfurospirillum arcachonense]
MQESRRGFLKKAAVVGTVAAVGTLSASESAKSTVGSNGVVVGKSPKKEILYKKTANWDAYYKASY